MRYKLLIVFASLLVALFSCEKKTIHVRIQKNGSPNFNEFAAGLREKLFRWAREGHEFSLLLSEIYIFEEHGGFHIALLIESHYSVITIRTTDSYRPYHTKRAVEEAFKKVVSALGGTEENVGQEAAGEMI
ncbi:hypothetical protein HYW53_00630 [Candidatus Giovannonibacteria bacterium]|nr:hypothetical protein [Candidatus Giovannonibacteria bacterium]